jgi:hypothetical protein
MNIARAQERDWCPDARETCIVPRAVIWIGFSCRFEAAGCRPCNQIASASHRDYISGPQSYAQEPKVTPTLPARVATQTATKKGLLSLAIPHG